MTAILLSVLIVGQCEGGYCPSPYTYMGGWRYPGDSVARRNFQVGGGYNSPRGFQWWAQPEMVGPVEVAYQEAPRVYGWDTVAYDGVTFRAYGYYSTSAGRKILNWAMSEPQNAANFEAAKKAKLAEADEPIPPAPPPVLPRPAVEPPKPESKPRLLTGVDSSRLTGEGYSVNGGRRTSQHVERGKSTQKAYLTVIGTAEERKRVEEDWADAPELRSFKPHFNFNSYDPSEWPVKPELGFVSQGHPVVIVQDFEGREVARGATYTGPVVLAMALRKAKDGYDPSKTPPLGGELAGKSLGILILGVVVLAAAAILIPRRTH